MPAKVKQNEPSQHKHICASSINAPHRVPLQRSPKGHTKRTEELPSYFSSVKFYLQNEKDQKSQHTLSNQSSSTAAQDVQLPCHYNAQLKEGVTDNEYLTHNTREASLRDATSSSDSSSGDDNSLLQHCKSTPYKTPQRKKHIHQNSNLLIPSDQFMFLDMRAAYKECPKSPKRKRRTRRTTSNVRHNSKARKILNFEDE